MDEQLQQETDLMSYLGNNCKKNATGRRGWLENRKAEDEKGKEREAEKIMGMGEKK